MVWSKVFPLLWDMVRTVCDVHAVTVLKVVRKWLVFGLVNKKWCRLYHQVGCVTSPA